MTELFWDYSHNVYKVQLRVCNVQQCFVIRILSKLLYSQPTACEWWWSKCLLKATLQDRSLSLTMSKRISEVTPGGLEFITLGSRLKASHLKFEESAHFNLSHQMMRCFPLCWHQPITLDVAVLVSRSPSNTFSVLCWLSVSHSSLICTVQIDTRFGPLWFPVLEVLGHNGDYSLSLACWCHTGDG